ncbi:retinol dehydrogenase 12-like [Leguminivora glycinivorella]|uniref:retinol dehydrogenase 12-like n=1 Tax=Leguminivora glycinivorella TaxID=1035111 RepID=UPI00200EFC96|nr:retinol dehydrogenase 12-like [Leguminivora glycinivorella]
MFLLAFLIINFTFAFLIWVYCKLTCGVCRSSRHLVGKTVIVTGGNGGIGYETAKDLAARGARVILACRNETRGLTAKDQIISATGNPDVHYRHLDLASLESVRSFADNILKTDKRLDVLVNNAGCYGSKFEKSEDGLLLEMQSNHFGPFLLTNLLLPLLKSSAPSRIVNVSSYGHNMGGVIDFDNLNAEKETKETYSQFKVYGITKLCNILMTVELERRLRGTGVTTNSLHPGVIATGIGAHVRLMRLIVFLLTPFCKTAWEGAQTTIHLAVAPELSDVSGRYFRDCREVKPSKAAQDTELARRLWDESERLVELQITT